MFEYKTNLSDLSYYTGEKNPKLLYLLVSFDAFAAADVKLQYCVFRGTGSLSSVNVMLNSEAFELVRF